MRDRPHAVGPSNTFAKARKAGTQVRSLEAPCEGSIRADLHIHPFQRAGSVPCSSGNWDLRSYCRVPGAAKMHVRDWVPEGHVRFRRTVPKAHTVSSGHDPSGSSSISVLEDTVPVGSHDPARELVSSSLESMFHEISFGDSSDRLERPGEPIGKYDDLWQLSLADPLTGLANRMLLLDRSEQGAHASPAAWWLCDRLPHRPGQSQGHQRRDWGTARVTKCSAGCPGA